MEGLGKGEVGEVNCGCLVGSHGPPIGCADCDEVWHGCFVVARGVGADDMTRAP